MGVYKRGRIWYIDYCFEGRRIRERVGKNRRQAENALESRKGEIVQGKFNLQKIKPTPYFKDFANEYLEWAKVNHRAWERMDKIQVKYLKEFFKGKRLRDITPWLIEKFKAQRKGEVSPATVNRGLAVLSSILSRAMQWGKLIDHPMKGGKVKKLREESVKERILSADEERKLVRTCSGWFRDFVVMALDTGMRVSELVNLKREDVDLNNLVVTVRHTKSGRDRKIPMTKRVVSMIRRRVKDGGDSEFVFPQGKGKWPWRVRSAFVRACKKASLQGLRFHDFRHTYATRLVTGGIDLATVQRLVGHQNIQMTIRYAHPGSEDVKRAVRVLERSAGICHKTVTNKKRGLQIISVTP